MTVAKPLERRLVDRASELALELGGEQPAAHPDLAVDAPDRQLDSGFAEREMPGADVVVDAVDQRPVEIEEEGDRPAHHLPQMA